MLDPSWLGRRLTLDLLGDLTSAHVDPCGEHGEYHTVVVDAPLFSRPIGFIALDYVCHDECWAVDLALDDHDSTGGSHVAGI